VIDVKFESLRGGWYSKALLSTFGVGVWKQIRRGLGVHNFIQFNRVLLGKWLWRYGREREALWRLVIDVKFESLRGEWYSKAVLDTFVVGVWKQIKRGWDKFCTLVRFEVGVGLQVSFWHD
jgi:hypothetical protein